MVNIGASNKPLSKDLVNNRSYSAPKMDKVQDKGKSFDLTEFQSSNYLARQKNYPIMTTSISYLTLERSKKKSTRCVKLMWLGSRSKNCYDITWRGKGEGGGCLPYLLQYYVFTNSIYHILICNYECVKIERHRFSLAGAGLKFNADEMDPKQAEFVRCSRVSLTSMPIYRS